MEQAVQDGRRDDLVAEDRAPIAIAFVAGENDAATLIASADQLEEDGRSEIIQRKIAHFVDDQNLGRQIHAHAPIQASFAIGSTEIVDQIVCGHKVGAEAGLNRRLGQGDTQMRFPDTGWSEKDDIARLMTKRNVRSSRTWRSSMEG